MVAPTPVSAYLHSATMVKAGVYLLARLHPAFGSTEEWTATLTVVGAMTMVVGAFVAMHERDMKLILAATTTGALGMMTLLLGMGTATASKAAMVFVVAHALYKGALFMVTGTIDRRTGTRQLDELGGLGRAMPLTFLAAVVGATGLAGFGPVASFVAKEAVLEAALEWKHPAGAFVTAAVVVAGALFAASAVILLRPFVGSRRWARAPREGSLGMLVGPAVLGLLSIDLGIAPGVMGERVIGPAATSVASMPVKAKLALWHGVNPALGLSVLGVAAGVGLGLRGRQVTDRTGRVLAARWFPSGGKVYDWMLTGMQESARLHTMWMQHGYLRGYIAIVLLTFVALSAVALVRWGGGMERDWLSPGFYEVLVALTVIGGATAAVVHMSRLAAVTALGAVGFGVALLYAFFGGPDLALTQIVIETMLVLLFVLVFYRLPKLVERGPLGRRLRDGTVALAVGATMSVLVMASLGHRQGEPISSFFGEHAVPEAFGRNVVNVILVDFRALDTLGEVAVIVTAALGVFALLRVRRWDQ